MEGLVVDTSVVSYLLKGHSLAPRYWEHLKGKLLGISFMSIAELYRWPLSRHWESRESPLSESISEATSCSPTTTR